MQGGGRLRSWEARAQPQLYAVFRTSSSQYFVGIGRLRVPSVRNWGTLLGYAEGLAPLRHSPGQRCRSQAGAARAQALALAEAERERGAWAAAKESTGRELQVRPAQGEGEETIGTGIRMVPLILRTSAFPLVAATMAWTPRHP